MGKSKASIIPKPRWGQVNSGSVEIDSSWKIWYKSDSGKEIKRTVKLLHNDFMEILGIDLKISSGKRIPKEKAIVAGTNDDDANFRKICSISEMICSEIDKEEGYCLKISKNITVTGWTEQGIFYGTQTLFQMAENGGHINLGEPIRLRQVDIIDWPDQRIRGLHFYPHYIDFENIVRVLSRYKINTIVVEYGNRFPFKKHKVISDQLAFKRNQLKKILKLARERYIEIVPLLECLGHTAFITEHNEYAHLREIPDKASLLCLSNPASFNLIKELVREMIEFHGGGKYFHIGADEAKKFGHCPQCANSIKKHGKSKVFIDYINKVSNFIKKKGKIPIMWDDMLRHFPENLNELDKDIIIHYWEYSTGDSVSVPYVDSRCHESWMRKRYDGKDWEADNRYLWWNTTYDFNIEKCDREKKEIFEKYWKTPGYPEKIRSFPYINFFQDQGHKVVGSPAAMCSYDGRICANYRMRIPNILSFIERLKEENSLGVITSCWNSVRELGYYALIFSAAKSWNVKIDEKSFDRKFCYQYYGLEDTSMVDIFYLLSGRINGANARKYEKQVIFALKLLDGIKEKVKKNKDDLIYFYATAKIASYEILWTQMVSQKLRQHKNLEIINRLKLLKKEIKKFFKQNGLELTHDFHDDLIQTIEQR